MKHIIFIFCFLFMVISAKADNPLTIIVMRKDAGLTMDSYHFSGSNRDLDLSVIKKFWDEGKRIKSVAYNANGWALSAAVNTGYTMQTYSYSKDFPTQWILDKYAEGYYITGVASGKEKWLVVMSQGTGYTKQIFFYSNGASLESSYNLFTSHGYRITNACSFGNYYFVVMSLGTNITQQVIRIGYGYNELTSFIQSNWNIGYRVSIWASDGKDHHFSVMSKFSDGSMPAEVYIPSTQPNINEYWNSGYTISSIGGGCPTYRISNCNICKAVGYQICSICNGYGSRLLLNRYQPCSVCNRTGKITCSICKGERFFKDDLLAGYPTSHTQNFNSSSTPTPRAFGVYNVNAHFQSYSINNGSRIDKDSYIYFNVDDCSILAVVNDVEYRFKFTAIATQDAIRSITLYTDNPNDPDERIALTYIKSNGTIVKASEMCLIISPKRNLNLSLYGFVNENQIITFIDQMIEYRKELKKH